MIIVIKKIISATGAYNLIPHSAIPAAFNGVVDERILKADIYLCVSVQIKITV